MSFYKLITVALISLSTLLQSELFADDVVSPEYDTVTSELVKEGTFESRPQLTKEEFDQVFIERRERQNAKVDAKKEVFERIFYATHSNKEFDEAMSRYEASENKAAFLDNLEKTQKPVKIIAPFYMSPVFKLLGFLALLLLLGIFAFGRRKKPVTS